MNVVILHGRLGKDPELRTTKGGTSVVDIRIATTERRKDSDGNYKDHAEWHSVVAYGVTAENVAKYLRKGDGIVVQGSLQTDEWEKDGQKHSRTKVNAHQVDFGARKSNSEAQPNGSSKGSNYSQPNQAGDLPFDDEAAPF